MKNPHLINIKNSIYTFSIDMNTLKCTMCGIPDKHKLCSHYIKLLYYDYKLDPLIISYAWNSKISKSLIEYRKNEILGDDKYVKEINEILIKELFSELDEIECSICMGSLWHNIMKNPDLYHCKQFKEIFHIKCINRWNKTKEDKDLLCPVCSHKHK